MLGVLRMDEMQEWERRDQRSGARVWDWVRCLGMACVVGLNLAVSHPRPLGKAEAFGVLERGAGIITHSSHHHNEQPRILMPVMMVMVMMMCLASTEPIQGEEKERKKERESVCVGCFLRRHAWRSHFSTPTMEKAKQSH